jgi:casein kinase II subunit alpha
MLLDMGVILVLIVATAFLSLGCVNGGGISSRAYPLGCSNRHPTYYTYDERDSIVDIDGVEDVTTREEKLHDTNRQNLRKHVDYRKLPEESSDMVHTYKRYEVVRKLGCGKFSDVYEAMDVSNQVPHQLVSTRRRKRRRTERRKRRHRRQMNAHSVSDGDSNNSSGNHFHSGGNNNNNYYLNENDATTIITRKSTTEEVHHEQNDNDDSLSPSSSSSSLVVLKCLKPISERKVRRELLVLTHCTEQKLPNLARLIGIILPPAGGEEKSMEDDIDDNNDNVHDIETASDIHSFNRRIIRSSCLDSSSRRRNDVRNHQDTQQQQDLQKQIHAQQLPAFILEHAGCNSQWLCHDSRSKQQQLPNSSSHRRSKSVPQPGGNINDVHYNHNNDNYMNNDDEEGQYLTELEVKYFLCHLLIALDGLHSAGIMHRDVKPRNTLINRHCFSSSRTDIHNNDDNDVGGVVQEFSIASPPPPIQSLMLVDLGLAEFYHPHKSYNVRVASRHYKSPELLIGYECYDYSIDMWAVGCILVGLLFRKEPFFHGKDNDDQLGQIVNVLGIRDFLRYYRRISRLQSSVVRDGNDDSSSSSSSNNNDNNNAVKMRLSYKAQAAIGKYCSWAPIAHALSCSSSSSMSSSEGDEDEVTTSVSSTYTSDMGNRKSWLSFLPSNCPIPSKEGLDLLDKLLVYDHQLRWTAKEALEHKFFDDIRNQVQREVQQRLEWERSRQLR